MKNYQENLNKKIEETKKVFEKMFSRHVSYHEEGGWGGKNGHFTIKLGNYKKGNNQEIEKKFKENTDIDITYHGKNSNGGNVISRKFKNSEVEKQKNELIKESAKENLNRHFIDNSNSLTYSTERINKDIVIKETYHELQSEEEENQIIERNRKKQEREKSRVENSPIQNEENQSAEKSIQQNKNQELVKNKNHEFPTGWVVGGGALIILGLTAFLVIRNKKKRN